MPHPDRLPPPARLAPGLRVVRRGLHHLQVGLYADRRVLLPRTPEVEATLTRLRQQRPLDDDAVTVAVLALLDEHGCLDRGRPPRAGPSPCSVGSRPPGLPDLEALLGTAGLTLTDSPWTADVVLVQASASWTGTCSIH